MSFFKVYKLRDGCGSLTRGTAAIVFALIQQGKAMVVKELADADEFDAVLKNSGNSLIVVDFYATWCGPCKMMAPKFARMSEEHTDVIFVKIDIDENETVVNRYDIKVMPTFVFIRDGKQIDIVEGSVADELQRKIAEHKAA